MVLYLDISLNIENFSESSAFFYQQKASLEHLNYLGKKFDVHVIRLGNSSFEEQHHSFRLHCFDSTFNALKKIKQLIGTKNNAIVVLHGFQHPLRTFLLRKYLGKDYSLYVQHHAEQPFQNNLKLFLQRLAYRKATGYFFTSRGNAKPFVSKKIITDEKKVIEVMEGSSYFKLKDQRECRRHLGLGDEPVFLWVGRLDQNKDPLTALTAFGWFAQSNKNARLYMIYSTDEQKKDIEFFIGMNDLKPFIKLVGKVEHEQLEKWYNGADVYLSSSRSEGSGYALCEALACGCYPVTTNIPSFVWMTGNERVGRHFSPGNSDELLLILNALDFPEIRKHKSERRKHFENLLSFEAIARTISNSIN
jgi:glycosyltransferase involved in cell wall biosynthesis